MSVTPANRTYTAAINDYLRDYADRHGNTQASRDEADSFIIDSELIVKDVVALVRKHTMPADQAELASEIASLIIDTEPYLIGKMVAVEVEKQNG